MDDGVGWSSDRDVLYRVVPIEQIQITQVGQNPNDTGSQTITARFVARELGLVEKCYGHLGSQAFQAERQRCPCGASTDDDHVVVRFFGSLSSVHDSIVDGIERSEANYQECRRRL